VKYLIVTGASGPDLERRAIVFDEAIDHFKMVGIVRIPGRDLIPVSGGFCYVTPGGYVIVRGAANSLNLIPGGDDRLLLEKLFGLLYAKED
jgi:hypothetical protein